MNEVNPKVLVVDDDVTVCRMLEERLSRSGYRVATVINGEHALRYCDQDPPDVLILDVNLPDIDGYQICEYVRNNVDAHDVAIVFLTGTTHCGTHTCLEQMVNRSGGDYFLVKPYDGALLVRMLDEITGRKESRASAGAAC